MNTDIDMVMDIDTDTEIYQDYQIGKMGVPWDH
jgi:hypothetical protein